MTDEWIEKTDAFLELAFARVKGAHATWCPYNICANTHRQTKVVMGKHLCKNESGADEDAEDEVQNVKDLGGVWFFRRS